MTAGTSHLPRLFALALLLGLLGTTAVLNHRSRGAGAAAPADTDDALARHGFTLTEVARAAGLDFRHRAPTFDAKLAHIMPEVASLGAAVAVTDFDGDGWMDLYVVDSAEGGRNRLYRNLADGRFEELAARVGLAEVNPSGTGVSTGSVWADYDNDGDPDLFLVKWGRPELFRNEAGRAFTRVTEGSGLPAWLNAMAATWLDFDRDGRLDLFVGGYYPDELDLWHLRSTRMMPESFEYAQNGGAKHLYRNLGAGRFEDVATAVGLVSTRWALAVAAADLRGTGWPDLVVANDYGVSEYYRNDQGRFREVGGQNGIGARPKSGMNVAFGDPFNDGRRAIYVTNISEEGNLVQGNNLWVPRPGGDDAGPRYDNMAQALGVELGGWSFGAQFGDLNNDGFQDLFLTNGYVSQDPTRSYWYDFSKIAGGHSQIIQDAALWPPIGNMSHSGYQRKRVWLNDGAGAFHDVAAAVGVSETFDGRAVALADFWNRGALDVVVAHQKGPLLLYKNTVAPGRAWIAFELEGRRSNRDAIGATVTVGWAGMRQTQDVLAASGFSAQNQRRLHFGLGEAEAVDTVTIRWPSGAVQELTGPALRQVHRLVEPEPSAGGAVRP